MIFIFLLFFLIFDNFKIVKKINVIDDDIKKLNKKLNKKIK